MTNFGGVGIKIMMHREQFEIEVERIDALMKAIFEQTELVAELQESFSKFYLQKVYGFDGNLQKIAGATDFSKSLSTCKGLIAKIHEEIGKLEKLQADCSQAQDRAKAVLPAYAAYVTNGREDTVPGRTFFLADKGSATPAGATPLAMPTRKQSTPIATPADAMLSHRFQR